MRISQIDSLLGTSHIFSKSYLEPELLGEHLTPGAWRGAEVHNPLNVLEDLKMSTLSLSEARITNYIDHSEANKTL